MSATLMPGVRCNETITASIILLLAISLPSPAPAYLLNLSTRLEIPPSFLNEDATSFIGGLSSAVKNEDDP
ncbi:MAG: hypothetical protein ABI540_02885 [Spartobacteria bacterium]